MSMRIVIRLGCSIAAALLLVATMVFITWMSGWNFERGDVAAGCAFGSFMAGACGFVGCWVMMKECGK